MLKVLAGHLRAGLRSLLFNLGLAGVALLGFGVWWIPTVSREEQTMFIAVPVGLFYLGLRFAAAALSHRKAPVQMRIEGTTPPPVKPNALMIVIGAAAIVAVVALGLAPTFLLALPIYAWLDMAWAQREALFVSGALAVVALIIVVAFIAAYAARTAWRHRDWLIYRVRSSMQAVATLTRINVFGPPTGTQIQ